MDMTPQGLAVNRSFEGRALRAYRDSVGVITIGYGNTNFDSFAVAYLGKKIEMGDTITEEQAEYLMVESLRRNYAPSVAKTMGADIKPNENDAGIIFHYNTGAIARASWVKFWKAKGNPLTIKASLLTWNKAGGKPLAGLTRRRAREGAILIDGDYGPEGRTKPPVINANGRVVKPTDADHPLAGTPGMMRLDDVGPAVADLNDSLEVLGFKGLKGDTFTLKTRDAVLAIQKSHPALVADGIAGPATRAVIGREADLKRKAKVIAGAGGAGGATGAAVDAASSFHIPGSVWATAGVLLFIAIGWIAFRYQDEVIALAKRIRE